MNIVADESVDKAIVDALRSSDHDVICVSEVDPGASDESVLALAAAGPRLLMTCDKDFGELVVRQNRVAAIARHEKVLTKSFTVINTVGVRIRGLSET